jgi:hypothetical protein
LYNFNFNDLEVEKKISLFLPRPKCIGSVQFRRIKCTVATKYAIV